MTTIRDVAKRAEVSVATVGRAIGGYGYVSAKTRAKVLREAKALGYQPNSIARSMIKRRTHTLAAIVSDNANPFFAAAVRGIEDVVLPHGYAILLCNADEDAGKEAMYIQRTREKRVDGVILSPSGGSLALLRSLVANGVPIVQIDRRLEKLKADAVLVDNRAGVRAAVEHLLRLGHRQIGIISGPRPLYTARERLIAYIDTLRSAGVTVEEDLILEGNFKQSSGYELVGQFLARRRRPSAIFIANNLMTIGALLRMKEAGVRVPEDIAVISFDDLDWSSILTPPLTAVAQPAYVVGATAAQLLVRRLDSSYVDQPQTIILSPTLIVRESCGNGRSRWRPEIL
jgi:LacI family transcriptional regulator, galactose operon repressor